MKRRITQQDIATRLKLDKSTVSLALRHHPNIAASTRQRVQQVALEMGYRPDAALSTLARQRWSGNETGSGATLAYLVDRRMEHHKLHRRFLAGVRARADERGYGVEVVDFADHASGRALEQVLHRKGIRGLLLPQFETSASMGLTGVAVENFTIVCLELGWVSVPFHIVAPDWFEITRQAWREVARLGYERIGSVMCHHHPRAVDDGSRYGGVASIQRELFPPEQVIPQLFGGEVSRDDFLHWFERHQPDALVVFVAEVCEWLESVGVRVPEDVGFASLCVNLGRHPHYSGILMDDDSIGHHGVDTLIASICAEEWGVPKLQRKLLFAPRWVDGKTMPPKTVGQGSRQDGGVAALAES